MKFMLLTLPLTIFLLSACQNSAEKPMSGDAKSKDQAFESYKEHAAAYTVASKVSDECERYDISITQDLLKNDLMQMLRESGLSDGDIASQMRMMTPAAKESYLENYVAELYYGYNGEFDACNLGDFLMKYEELGARYLTALSS